MDSCCDGNIDGKIVEYDDGGDEGVDDGIVEGSIIGEFVGSKDDNSGGWNDGCWVWDFVVGSMVGNKVRWLEGVAVGIDVTKMLGDIVEYVVGVKVAMVLNEGSEVG